MVYETIATKKKIMLNHEQIHLKEDKNEQFVRNTHNVAVDISTDVRISHGSE